MDQEKISSMKLIKIGSSKDNDIVIKKNKNISPYHCEIFEDDDHNIFLTDLNSTKGSFINNKKLKGSAMLKSNDIVKLGSTILPWNEYLNYQKEQYSKSEKDYSEEKNKETLSNKNTITIKNDINSINLIKQSYKTIGIISIIGSSIFILILIYVFNLFQKIGNSSTLYLIKATTFIDIGLIVLKIIGMSKLIKGNIKGYKIYLISSIIFISFLIIGIIYSDGDKLFPIIFCCLLLIFLIAVIEKKNNLKNKYEIT